MTIAVEDNARIMPTATASRGSTRRSIAAPASTSVLSATCRPPNPRIGSRIFHNLERSISRPITNNINTTPNSAKCITSSRFSPTQPNAAGPITAPMSEVAKHRPKP